MRRTLVAALVSCAGEETKSRLRRFLAGLSADELEFLADFQAVRIIERSSPSPRGWDGPHTPDREHKMLVLSEYLARCGRRACGPYFDQARSGENHAAGLA